LAFFQKPKKKFSEGNKLHEEPKENEARLGNSIVAPVVEGESGKEK
jgi:hypothetical protein